MFNKMGLGKNIADKSALYGEQFAPLTSKSYRDIPLKITRKGNSLLLSARDVKVTTAFWRGFNAPISGWLHAEQPRQRPNKQRVSYTGQKDEKGIATTLRQLLKFYLQKTIQLRTVRTSREMQLCLCSYFNKLQTRQNYEGNLIMQNLLLKH